MTRKVIIDTDPGCDDTAMLCSMLSHKDVEVLALTTVFGNNTVEQTTTNACRILEFLGRTDVPVHKGAHIALDKASEEMVGKTHIHGNDGMNDPPSIPVNPTKKPQPDTFGPLEICKLAQQYPGEITLIAIGPLTNIAIAVKILPQLPLLLKSFFIMGGSTEIGNITRWGEFNFLCDPLSAGLVLERFTADILVHLVPWETCLNNRIPFEEYFDLFKDPSVTSKQKVLLKEVGWSPWDQDRYDNHPDAAYRLSDQFVSLALLYPSSITQVVIYKFCSVVTNREDPKNALISIAPEDQGSSTGIKIYEKFDMKYALKMYSDAFEAGLK